VNPSPSANLRDIARWIQDDAAAEDEVVRDFAASVAARLMELAPAAPADQTVPTEALDEALTAARSALRQYAIEERGELGLTPAQAAIRVLDVAAPILAAAGRAQAAADLAETFKRIADSTRQSLVSTPPEYATEQHTHRVRARAFERAAEIAKGSP
jgi:hypothetical protein